MTREEIKQICQIYDNLRVERDAATIAYNSDDAFWEHVLVTYKLSQPSLPSNLDEAALKAYPKMSRVTETHGAIPADNQSHDLGDANEEQRIAFKAGAEWKAAQGVNGIGIVSKLADRAWVTPISPADLERQVFDNFVVGEKVIIQFLKK